MRFIQYLSLLLAPILTLLFFTAPVTASGLQASRESRGDVVSRPSSSSLFPLITRMRDAAIEFFFGAYPSSSHSHAKPGIAVAGRYARQTVIRFNVTTTSEEAALAEAAERLFLDIWSFNNVTGTVDIRLDKEDVMSLLSLLPKSLHRSFSPLIPDLSVAVQATYPSSAKSRDANAIPPLSGGITSKASKMAVLSGGVDNVFFQDYQPLPVIVQWLKLLDVMFPHVSMISVGQTAEGRDIVGLRVGASQDHGGDDDDYDGDGDADEFEEMMKKHKKHKKGKGHKNKKTRKHHKARPTAPPPPPPTDPEPIKKKQTILVTGGLHAREWISVSTVNYVAWSLISGYGKTGVITKLLDHFDVVFVPVVNPDGYEYTWHMDRLWRKTRQGTNFRYCRGLDLDHAFGFEWDSNARAEPCSETYGGEAAFQAVEARTLSAWARNETENNGVEFVGLLDLHSYSQQIMFPFSYSCTADPPNLENLEELAAGIAKAIRLTTGEVYSTSSACEGVLGYDAAGGRVSRIESGGGSAIDWFYHELKAKYSYQIKLRDTGNYGFLLPSTEIVPTGEEIFSAVKYFGDFLLGNNGIEKSLDESEAPREDSALFLADDNHSDSNDGDDDDDDSQRWVELRRRRQR